MRRTKTEISRDCEEIGLRKGTKGHTECVNDIEKFEKLMEKDVERKQREAMEKKLPKQ